MSGCLYFLKSPSVSQTRQPCFILCHSLNHSPVFNTFHLFGNILCFTLSDVFPFISFHSMPHSGAHLNLLQNNSKVSVCIWPTVRKNTFQTPGTREPQQTGTVFHLQISSKKHFIKFWLWARKILFWKAICQLLGGCLLCALEYFPSEEGSGNLIRGE